MEGLGAGREKPQKELRHDTIAVYNWEQWSCYGLQFRVYNSYLCEKENHSLLGAKAGIHWDLKKRHAECVNTQVNCYHKIQRNKEDLFNLGWNFRSMVSKLFQTADRFIVRHIFTDWSVRGSSDWSFYFIFSFQFPLTFDGKSSFSVKHLQLV